MAHKVAINIVYGGFRLSEKAKKRYKEISGKELPWDYWDAIPRHDPALIQTIEELGEDANGDGDYITIEEIPGNRYRIEEYDGIETIHYPEEENWIVIEED